MARINMTQLVMALTLALAAALLQGTTADDHTVGGTSGWTNVRNTTFYSAWASNFTFEVGDRLVFNFANGAHDVATVTKDAYDACTTANTINLIQNGPATVTLNTTGTHYFICTIAGHCSAGQKLSVNVVADSDTPPSPPTTGTTSPPPPPSSASSRGVAFAFAFVLMSLAIALFC
ncbi:hypothetical protein ACOSP7_015578 [Xanthoceras sorbifolium]